MGSGHNLSDKLAHWRNFLTGLAEFAHWLGFIRSGTTKRNLKIMLKGTCLMPNSVLPPWERILYVVVWMGAVAYGTFTTIRVSMEYRESSKIWRCMGEGWRILGLTKDKSDYEWQFWTKDVLSGVLTFMIGQGILSQFILHRVTSFKWRSVVYILYSIVFAVWGMGIGPTVFYITFSFIVVLCAWFTRSSFIVWVLSLIHLTCMNIPAGHHFLEDAGLVYGGFGSNFLFQEYFITLGILRYTSFSLYLCKQSSEMSELCKGDSNDAVPDALTGKLQSGCHCKKHLMENLILGYCYLLYVPLAVGGPFVTFEVYSRQLWKSPVWNTVRIRLTVKNAIRFIVWLYLYDLSTHYIYSSCMLSQPLLMRTLKLNEILSVGYTAGIAFMIKYLVIYSLGRTFALLDNVYAPDGPSCVAHIASYSVMWRKFDRGLNQFMVTHIYIPLGGSRLGFTRQAIAIMICFLFITLWHGVHDDILYWTSINCLTVLLEAVGARISRSEQINKIEISKLSPAGSRRVRSIISTPLVTISTFAIFFFLGNSESGFIISYRVIVEGFPWAILLVLCIGYCLVQVSKEVENWNATTKERKSE